ncbi:LPS export ABC transporter ATP-binding protein [Helicobacter pullorum]|uniref:ABC transporter n=2 Tax=Helicobacter pullorum TaxID=35818 RepID=A0A0N1MP67_9HELI|nr:LPS export ABC transporter ATP-binding protein [Helicobacter pullorum]KAB0574731.1 LPS export ABC transporter ATP-binding protein [Helicobacter pullorum NCTC 12824]EEQ63811.1 lipopolysaccharide ABC transporter, ATP-binding protein LptB [Helicobacter pullorum MIT 98-5489]KPH50351.1 ABC transporter [Helicobacter pullorum]KPH52020.1 ABC transporter [Helicobacter pullorum]KPH52880.1 ABC transporter [Helicobacter pullorum]
MHKLEAKNLVKTIKKTKIISDISMEVRSGEVVGLLGPNGAGKTTSFYIICGLLLPSSGKVFFDNRDITGLSLHKRSQLGIGYLPQESSVFKDLSVEENLMIAAEVCLENEEERMKRIEELLEEFNIEPIRNRKGVNLSGGERRRVEIARALVKKPKFILLDEPFAGVDPIAVLDIQNIIKKLLKFNIGVLITDHNVRETLSVCNRAYVINKGMLLASGDSNEIYENELVRRHYLGENFRV